VRFVPFLRRGSLALSSLRGPAFAALAALAASGPWSAGAEETAPEVSASETASSGESAPVIFMDGSEGVKEAVPAEPAEEAAKETIYLRPLERFRLDLRGALLTIADFNGDQRSDFLVADQGQNILVAYYSQSDPVRKAREFRLESDGDWVWRERKMVLASKPSALVAGDFNGDGKTDVAFAAQDGKGGVLYQGKDGLDEQPEELSESAKQLAAADLNEDGRMDLIVAGDQGLAILLQSAGGILATERRMSSSGVPQDPMILQDMDGDGLRDLVFIDPSDRASTIIRFGMANGLFGPESRQRIGDNMTTVGLGNRRVASLEPNTRAIGVFELAQPARGALSAASRPPLGGAQVLPLPSELAGGKLSMALLETKCRPGLKEALIGLSKGAQLLRLTRGDLGRFHFEQIPSFSDVVAVAAGPDHVYVLSQREKTLGVLSCESLEELGKFPTPVPLAETSLTFAIGPFMEGEDALWRVYRAKDKEDEELTVEAMSLGEEPQTLASGVLEDTFDFAPEKIVPADANNDGQGDFILFFEYEEPRLYLRSVDGFELMKADQALKRGLLAGVKPLNLTFGDWDNDGQTEMIIARDGYLRAYHLDAEGTLTIEKQFNARSLSAKLSAPTLMDADDDGQMDIIALQDSDQLVAFLAADPTEPRSVKIPKIDARAAAAGDFTADGRDDLALLGAREVAIFEGGGVARELAAQSRTLTDIEDGLFGAIAAGPLLQGKRSALVAIEVRENMMEFFAIEEDGSLRSIYRFKVFDDPRPKDDSRLRRFGAEPREVVIADVDGDGLMDVAALAHENVLVYRQSTQKPATP
jgi:hypothetical protein